MPTIIHTLPQAPPSRAIAAIHQRLTLALHGVRRAPWLVPAAVLVALFGALVIFAWSRQL